MTLYMHASQPFEVSNDNWEFYIQQFERFLLENKIVENEEECHMLLALVGAPTFKLLASLAAPKQPGELKFKDICDILKKHHLPQPIKTTERHRFFNRKQLQGKSAIDYLAELQTFASTCKFGAFLKEAPCDRLVCAMRDCSMQLGLLAGDLLLKKAFELMSMEVVACHC